MIAACATQGAAAVRGTISEAVIGQSEEWCGGLIRHYWHELVIFLSPVSIPIPLVICHFRISILPLEDVHGSCGMRNEG